MAFVFFRLGETGVKSVAWGILENEERKKSELMDRRSERELSGETWQRVTMMQTEGRGEGWEKVKSQFFREEGRWLHT